MGLNLYKKKRDFKKSPEPQGGKPGQETFRFVVQKHAASHLHYDFRLELDGTLKSWAVPKGPSLNPAVKRLAMQVEDHPYDYRNFEGVIPSGYGAGTVMVWDEGTYTAAGLQGSKKNISAELRRQLKAGKLKFQLQGIKLKGQFVLVKAPARGENAWLLMKVKDEFSSPADILTNDTSVLSGKNLEELAASPSAIYKNGKSKPVKTEKTVSARIPKNKASAKSGVRKAFTLGYKPMLATLVDKPFDEPGWIYEIKWDGYRALAFLNKNKAELRSRNDKSFNEKFYPVHKALADWGIRAVLDGEIVVVNEAGISDFGALQNWRSEADGTLLFYVFDVLWLEGKDLTGVPLDTRRRLLKEIPIKSDILRLSENFGDSAQEFFEAARLMGLEGIIAKKSDSLYYPGERSKEWLKIKANKRQEVVIGGFTKNESSARVFSSLLVGVQSNGELMYTGKVGTGLDQKTQTALMKKFKSITTKKCPFALMPDVNKPSRFRPNPPKAEAVWLKPRLVGEVTYAELTKDGVMRHPSFVGLREDKSPNEVQLEKPVVAKKLSVQTQPAFIKPEIKKERKTLLNPSEETQVKKIKGHELKFTNLSKIFWPESGFTKRDLINYYYQVAPYILPYLKDRPQSLNRHPNGIHGKSFYQKDVTGKAPGWVKTFLYHSEADHRDKHFLVGNDEATLLYMASLGCIEINPWSSTIRKPNHPTWCIIDLDPDKNSFNQVIEAARVTKEVLDHLGVPSYCKTSGSTGLHVYIPMGAKYTYEQSKEFARVIATMVHNELPRFTSIERMVKNRKGKMYIDFLQNRAQATVAAPYAVRPKPGATVSMPLHWEEVKKGLKMSDFTITNAVARLKEQGDLFQPVLGPGIDLEKTVELFENGKQRT